MVAIGQHHTGPIAVNFTYSTGIYHDLTPRSHWGNPMAYDIGHHATVAQHQYQHETGACEYLNGATCYYDGSSLAADRYLEALNQSGPNFVWMMLDRYLVEFAAELGEKP
ncbi:hypothetical protein [Demequina sp. SO4-18]|uniref:hypothetical protein n=1 Tax=Demequina sp. SO4-18 TaxID=3401026 RepID=UPI003B59EA92